MKKNRILFRKKMSKQVWGYLSNLVKWVLNKISLIDIKDWPMTIMGSKHLTVFPKFNINVMTDLLNSNLFNYHWLKQKKSVNTYFLLIPEPRNWNEMISSFIWHLLQQGPVLTERCPCSGILSRFQKPWKVWTWFQNSTSQSMFLGFHFRCQPIHKAVW